MNWLFLALGIAVGMASGAGGGQYLMAHVRIGESNAVTLPAKYFADYEDEVVVSGTLVDRSIGVANNSYTIDCYKERKECWIATFNQTDVRTISRIEPLHAIKIADWTPSKITALTDGASGCAKSTITIERKTKEVLWVVEPVNQSKLNCKTGDTRIRTHSLENSHGWKKLREAGYGASGPRGSL
jgi:hypothetical protein